ncbi:MAG: branched-chain amino acid ABC transporter permease [Euzebyales bacterium]|nr:branched-chain amino acid ABC transporter permease [Euzebyales bacterium]MBA3621644.1 branched-chain amino acid ABC transporter permease [Euzebyales bacterium]
MDIGQLPQALINGILLGGVYALVAAGLSLIFGVMRVINFAHGEFLMLGGMLTYWLFALFAVNPLLSLAIVMPAFLLLGAATQRALIARITGAPPMMSLLLTFGLSYFLIGVSQAAFGNIFRSVPFLPGSWRLLGVVFPKTRAIAFFAAAVVATAVFAFLRYTRSGKAIRATSQHPEVAMACGVDIAKVRRHAFALGVAMAALAGSLLVTITAMHPQAGTAYILKAFAIVVLGGLGSFLGALAGGLILGLTEVLGSLYISSAVGQASAYLVLLVVLLTRPGGLAGQKVAV